MNKPEQNNEKEQSASAVNAVVSVPAFIDRIVDVPCFVGECDFCGGDVEIFEPGSDGTCKVCKKEYTSDFELHPELSDNHTEYWILPK